MWYASVFRSSDRYESRRGASLNVTIPFPRSQLWKPAVWEVSCENLGECGWGKLQQFAVLFLGKHKLARNSRGLLVHHFLECLGYAWKSFADLTSEVTKGYFWLAFFHTISHSPTSRVPLLISINWHIFGKGSYFLAGVLARRQECWGERSEK